LVQFIDGDDNIVYEEWVLKGAPAADPFANNVITMPVKTEDVQFTYIYSNWDKDFSEISEPMKVYAVFTNELRDYPVYFYNGVILLQETREYYGTTASYN
jgi:hypothetical protein